ncbi:hypothetical protein [Alkalimarinus sediminis]|uniref:Uncharacterized protein n=1 Tax=Alkalimarinus sediminis TaxID=1632866 RepID=A0A9E8KPP6_9ALTE|nr:hypothetical protein [Alkalimarinus sediminis]UZW74944.1 hypothetical protein NNL22_18280 [Alkalimarinus sediminis]
MTRHSLCLAITILTATTSFAANPLEAPNKADNVTDKNSVIWTESIDSSNTTVSTSNPALWQVEATEPQIDAKSAQESLFNRWQSNREPDSENSLFSTDTLHVSGGSSISGWILIALAALGLINILSKKSKK